MTEFLALLTLKEFVSFVVTTISAFRLAHGLSGVSKSQTLLLAWSTKMAGCVA
jgi:hypothetical protein